MWGKRVTAVLAALVLGTAPAWAQNFSTSVDRYFRLEWDVGRAKDGGPRITGHLHNDRLMWDVNVRVLVEALDTSGRTVSKTRDYVNDVPPEGRSYFDATVPSGGATYRVSVESFDWLKAGPSN